MTHRRAFARLLSRSVLEELAGERYFKRGLAYFRDGAVIQLRLGKDGISARVGGTEPCPYFVRFWIEEQKLQWGCACPLGSGGAFCKHLVATGLAWLSGKGQGIKADFDPLTPEAIREMLETAGERALAEIVRQRAAWDEGLLAELALASRASRHEEPERSGHRNTSTRKRHASRRKPSSSAD